MGIRFGLAAVLIVSFVAPVRSGPPGSCSLADSRYPIGLARIDITPEGPIRLNGYAARGRESDGVDQRLGAKALAIGTDAEGPAVLLTADICTMPAAFTEELAGRLARSGVRRERFVLNVSHSHTVPVITGSSRNLFGVDLPEFEQKPIDRYTRWLLERLEQVCRQALADRKPARLAWGNGQADFAFNRRTRGGPVDHDLPVLRITALDGKLRGVVLNYACHCVALGTINRVSGDWAGYAQETIEREHPGSVVLVTTGCGGDQNPAATAPDIGRRLATEVNRVLATPLAPVAGPMKAAFERVALPLEKAPAREEWERRLQAKEAHRRRHARLQLDLLDQGKPLPSEIVYPVQTWTFGDDLALVFLGGEAVVDYSLRLKRELDFQRLWVCGYSNEVDYYVPSERVRREGGYEADIANTIYYGHPSSFRAGLEDKIIGTVRRLVGPEFAARYNPAGIEGTRPLSPQQSLTTIRTKPELAVQLVAAEPLVVSPVAIDFGPDGKLWVAEMYDYPTGLDGKFKPGGRIKVLEDTDGDGLYDKATVFCDNLPFPTGVKVWRKGVLVTAAPYILYLEDTDGDGKADVRKVLYEGFATGNYQARINGLAPGLDNWVYAASGWFGGKIKSYSGVTADVRYDCRLKPDTGAIEPASGSTQQGLAHDDWGDWFGCHNTALLLHFPLVDHYVARNPQVAPPSPILTLGGGYGRLYPTSQPLVRYNDPGDLNHVTSGCGVCIYRDDLLGPEYAGDSFTCEPVHDLIVRLKVKPTGVTFAADRPPDERQTDFLTSSDNWFRPVQVRTGPDGALWVVDMYRFLVEHPDWISPDRLATIDVRAGCDMGRIYRVFPRNHPPRSVPRLSRLDTPALVAALDSPNGTLRDLVQEMLVWKQDPAAVTPLRKLVLSSRFPQARAQALCTLDGLSALTGDVVLRALGDDHPGVRRHAIRLGENLAGQFPDVGVAMTRLVNDPHPKVRQQLAFSLGEWADPRAAKALAELAVREGGDPYLLSAVLSSVHKSNLGPVTAALLEAKPDPDKTAIVWESLLGLAASWNDSAVVAKMLPALLPRAEQPLSAGHFAFLSRVFESWDASQVPASLKGVWARASSHARELAFDAKAPEKDRLAAINFLGHGNAQAGDLATLLEPRQPPAVQEAAVRALVHTPRSAVATELLAGWAERSPALQGQILDALLSREEWTRRLLTEIQKATIPPAQIDAVHRQRLLVHPNAAVQEIAAKLFAAASNRDRQKVLADHRGVLSLRGDRLRGKAAFAKRCAVCHQLDGVGHAVGPDLGGYANKFPQDLLVAVLDPNQVVEAKYVNYLAATTDGRVFTGILAGETASSITLRGEEGKEQTILRTKLESLRSTGKSLMPEGLERDLSRQDLADLITYVVGNGPPAKTLAGNQPKLVEPLEDGSYYLPAAQAEIFGNEITFEADFHNIGFWHGEQDRVAWTVNVKKAGRFNVILDWACADDSAGNRFVLEGGEAPVRGAVLATGGWDKYMLKHVGDIVLKPGKQRLTLRPDGKLTRRALMDLKGVKLTRDE